MAYAARTSPGTHQDRGLENENLRLREENARLKTEIRRLHDELAESARANETLLDTNRRLQAQQMQRANYNQQQNQQQQHSRPFYRNIQIFS